MFNIYRKNKYLNALIFIYVCFQWPIDSEIIHIVISDAKPSTFLSFLVCIFYHSPAKHQANNKRLCQEMWLGVSCSLWRIVMIKLKLNTINCLIRRYLWLCTIIGSLNSCSAKFILRNMKTYFYFLSFLTLTWRGYYKLSMTHYFLDFRALIMYLYYVEWKLWKNENQAQLFHTVNMFHRYCVRWRESTTHFIHGGAAGKSGSIQGMVWV